MRDDPVGFDGEPQSGADECSTTPFRRHSHSLSKIPIDLQVSVGRFFMEELTQPPSGKAQQRDRRIDVLCLFAVLNPLIIQASFFFLPPDRRGGLSVPQVFQGTAFLIGLAIIFGSRWRPSAYTRRMAVFVVLGAVASAVFLSKSLIESGDLTSIMRFRGDFVVYFKMVFWSSSWFLIAALVQRSADATRLLRAVTLGALLTSVIVVVCYITGAGTIKAYALEGVRASIGASGVSAKHTVPYLAASAFVAMYLTRRGRWSTGLIAAFVLLAATLVSYDRAVQVGLLAAGAWLLFWRFVVCRRQRIHTGEKAFVACALISLVIFGIFGFESLQKRWTGDLAKNRPGSGRLGFYQAAVERFTEGPASDVLLGVGYSGIRETMEERCGMSVHTHSDLFDSLLGGGILGLCVYAAFFWALGGYFRGVPRGSPEFALMGATGIVYVVMGLITGLTTAPHANFCLGAIFHCSNILARTTDLNSDEDGVTTEG